MLYKFPFPILHCIRLLVKTLQVQAIELHRIVQKKNIEKNWIKLNVVSMLVQCLRPSVCCKHNTLKQCCFNIGSPSTMLAQHVNNMCRGEYCDVNVVSLLVHRLPRWASMRTTSLNVNVVSMLQATVCDTCPASEQPCVNTLFYVLIQCLVMLTGKNETLNQCCFNVGPPSSTFGPTLKQHWLNVRCLLCYSAVLCGVETSLSSGVDPDRYLCH